MTINATGSAPGTSVTSSPTQECRHVYVLNTGMFRSGDAGKTFTLLPAPHGDHHGLWIDSANPRRMIMAMTAAPRLARRRADLEHAVQPAHGAVLPRDRR